VKRIRLGNTVFEGANDVYLLEGDGLGLVDTGVAVPEVRAELESGLADHGHAVADLDAIYLTHWHPDHAGLAGDLQAESGADVFVHEADAPLVAGTEPMFLEDPAAQRAVFDTWGLPADARERLRGFLGGRMGDLTGRPAEVTTFVDGDALDAPGGPLEAVHLPGHAAGLSAFAFAEGDVDNGGDVPGADDAPDGAESAYVGDAILPKYTPNVGGADVRVDAPLARYAESLVRIVGRDWHRAHPGHRDVITDPAARAAGILEHHRERTRRVVGVLREHGPADAWTVSANLFGDLDRIHVLHGPGEAYAHLDHLADAGVADPIEDDGTTRYELVDPDPDVDALFPATRLCGTVGTGE